MLTVSAVLGTFARPELLLGVKGHSSCVPLGSAGTVLAAFLPSETWSGDVCILSVQNSCRNSRKAH